MTIHLPNDLESRVQATVRSGRFASVDDAMAEAARLLLRELDSKQPAQPPGDSPKPPDTDPLWGMMRDDADLMDEIVAGAYRNRREEIWRDPDL